MSLSLIELPGADFVLYAVPSRGEAFEGARIHTSSIGSSPNNITNSCGHTITFRNMGTNRRNLLWKWRRFVVWLSL